MIHEYGIDLNRILLRPLTWEDIESLRILRNREKDFFLDNSEISEEQQKKWYGKYLLREDDIMFTIKQKSAPLIFCGAIALYGIDRAKGVCEIGRTLVDKERCPDKGIGLEATCGACRFAFEVLEIRKIQTQILKTNIRSMKLHQRAGFYVVDSSDERFCLVEITREVLRD